MTCMAIPHWLELLEANCTHLSTTCLDLIIDQAGCDVPLLPSVRSVEPAMAWQSLFDGLPEEGALDQAPLLVRVDLAEPLQRQWLHGLIDALRADSRLLALVSLWSFPALAQYLGRCLAVLHDNREGLLRYYDPRVFALLFNHVLEPEQQQRLLRPAVFWSWLDRDGSPHRLNGAASEPQPDEASVFEFNDRQAGRLSVIPDAVAMTGTLADVLPCQWSAEQCFQACYAAMLVAADTGLTTASECTAFVRDMVCNAERVD